MRGSGQFAGSALMWTWRRGFGVRARKNKKTLTYKLVCCICVRVRGRACVRVNGVCHRRGKVGVLCSVNLSWLLFHGLTARGAHALLLRRCPCAATGEINADETDTNCMKLDKWLLYENGPRSSCLHFPDWQFWLFFATRQRKKWKNKMAQKRGAPDRFN